jgi:rhomboid protease GluP
VELNHIFLFIAIVTPLTILARGWRPGPNYRGWRIAAIIVLAITGGAWLLFRNVAGFIGGGAWLALLFLPSVGLKRVMELSAQQRYESARRIATALQILHPTADMRQQIQMLRMLEARQNTEGSLPPPPPIRPRRLQNAPVVIVFIALNVAMFLVEFAHYDLRGNVDLLRFGALQTEVVLTNHEYWRLITALFLHYGIIHLVFNLFALYVLGPPLERAIGTIRFCLCYMMAGLGSTLGVVLLTKIHVVSPGELVGASGCIMGIVGASAGFLLRHHHMPMAKQRLMNMAMIVVIQTMFDLSTPQVSMSAHLCGLVTGFLAGLLLAPKKMPLYR